MLHTNPSDDQLYDALVRRDPAFDGRAYVGVTTTGIFCRLTCPARKPKRTNSRFFASVADCLEAGFRPCKRCRPLSAAGEADPVVETLTRALDANPARRWTEQDLIAAGLDPSTVRRAFKRHFGVTFLEMARLRRLQAGAGRLAEGGRVIDAQLEAGFESASGFREAFARLLGRPPAEMIGGAELAADWLGTPLGPMIAVADGAALRMLEFADRRELPAELAKLRRTGGEIAIGRRPAIDRIESELDDYFSCGATVFQTPIEPTGGEFARRVWRALREIPPGRTRSYGELAEAIGRPGASRAVARANASNSLAIVIPCHRVVGADGSLAGYAGGVWRKRWLLDHERRATP